jgi:phosphoglycerol transferase MdoB-like AlkP superfamily enzyme
MESIKRVTLALAYFAFIFAGVIYIYPYDKVLALLFNMVCLATLCSYLASNKNRSKSGWFFIGLFTGIIGLGMVLGIKPIESNEK